MSSAKAHSVATAVESVPAEKKSCHNKKCVYQLVATLPELVGEYTFSLE